ncbi:hypothetical protein HDV01_001978 [Terramyces sp. JEL0728]|nr:hypothetical protein HDV01_001978 [Terramyces sp. JEL0728]
MQEVTVKQRSTFTHYITVDSPGKEICWNFCTRKKNISFGLFKKETDLPLSRLNTFGGSLTNISSSIQSTPPPPISPPRQSMVEKNSRMSVLNSQQSAPNIELNQISSHTKSRSRDSNLDKQLTEILPIAHYESSKLTIKGTYLVQEPGTFVLVFDNSFSVKTSKKLFFFVGIRDVEPKDTSLLNINQKEGEGWLLKKGKRSMQGYNRRWVEVHSTGFLTYYKSPGGQSHGSVNLTSNSSQNTFHFKVEFREDMDRWVNLFQKFANTQSPNLGLDFGGDSSILEPVIPRPESGVSPSPSLDNIDFTQKRATAGIENLQKEIQKLKDMIDSSKSRFDSGKNHNKDTAVGLLSCVAVSQTQLNTLNSTTRLQKEKVQYSHSNIEAAFFTCLNDNNKLRKKYGLELVTASKFQLDSEYRHEIGSIISSIRNDDVFYDAEEGASDDDSSDGYSVHDAEAFTIIDDDESDRDSMTSTQNKTAAASEVGTITVEIPEKRATVTQQNVRPQVYQYVRRTVLPVPASSMENISIMGILRNNMGKDLSTVAMPIALNEPINLLQKLCEELEYCELLDLASKQADPVERLCLVAGFVVSGYSSTVYRAARKPFNPLLGETYEFDRPDKGFKYIAEKVSHHPPIMACHAESPNYIYYQDSLLKTKFWGKSMELNNVGTAHLEFPALDEHYVWQKVTTSMRNMFSAGRYLEHHGTTKIVSKATGHYCELVFKESGYFSSANNEVVGGIYNSAGKKLISVRYLVLMYSGRWDHSLNKFSDSSPNTLEVIWRIGTFPPNYAENYGFTQFAIELNELTPDLHSLIPNTDTRYRTDQRLYEEGRIDEAEAEKLRLEQKQRDTRKQMESDDIQWIPQYFTIADSPDSEAGTLWKYKGNYWPLRGKFPADNIDLFS